MWSKKTTTTVRTRQTAVMHADGNQSASSTGRSSYTSNRPHTTTSGSDGNYRSTPTRGSGTKQYTTAQSAGKATPVMKKEPSMPPSSDVLLSQSRNARLQSENLVYQRLQLESDASLLREESPQRRGKSASPTKKERAMSPKYKLASPVRELTTPAERVNYSAPYAHHVVGSLAVVEAEEKRERLLIQLEQGLLRNQMLSQHSALSIPVNQYKSHLYHAPKLLQKESYAQSMMASPMRGSPQRNQVRAMTPTSTTRSSPSSLRPTSVKSTVRGVSSHSMMVSTKLFMEMNVKLLEAQYMFLQMELEKSHQTLLTNTSRALYQRLCDDYNVLARSLKNMAKRNKALESQQMGRYDRA